MGEVGTATNEQQPPPLKSIPATKDDDEEDVVILPKENGSEVVNGESSNSNDGNQKVVGKISQQQQRGSRDEMEEENSQQSQPAICSSNGDQQTEDDEATEDSRPGRGTGKKAAAASSVGESESNQDTIESMEVDDDETEAAKMNRSSSQANASSRSGSGNQRVSEDSQKSKEATATTAAMPMEVDSATSTNGHHSVRKEGEGLNLVTKATEKMVHDDDDSDKPVSINSDSENDEAPPTVVRAPPAAGSKSMMEASVFDATMGASKANGQSSGGGLAAMGGATMAKPQPNGDCDDVTILSDKEDDCVVIEDEDEVPSISSTTPSQQQPQQKATDLRISVDSSPRRSSRARKNILPHDISTIDDEDEYDEEDDIEEIIDDPLIVGAAKKPRLSMNQPFPQQQPGPFPFNRNQLQMSSPHTPQPPSQLQQKSLLVPGAGVGGVMGVNKEPSLVIIDTNTLMNRTSPGTTISPMMTATPKSAYSALPAGMSPNSSFNSPRNSLGSVGSAPITPVNLIKTVPPPLTPVTPLLPALTDDMFVLEAPSFIVPYIYEKPPVINLREFVDELEVKIKELRKKLESSEEKDSAEGKDDAGKASEAGGEEESQAAASDGDKKTSSDATAAAAGSSSDKKSKSKSKRKGGRASDDDEEWDEMDTSTDDEASDEEQKTKVLIKEVRQDIAAHMITPPKDDLVGGSGSSTDPRKSENYFENPLGKFFMNIGINLVQEYVQQDLLRQHKRKRDREGKPSAATTLAIGSLMKNLEHSKENNRPFKFEMKRCEYCPFRSESVLVMAQHYETPHMRNYVYKCNFCSYETRPPHDILYHMEAIHNIKGKLEKAPMYHACPNCPFEDNGKSKLARHAVACAKKFRPEINLNPPLDWEPPAKIPRIKPKHGLVGTATAYQAMTAQQQKNLALATQQRIQPGVTPGNMVTPVALNINPAAQAAAMRARGGGVGTTVVPGGIRPQMPPQQQQQQHQHPMTVANPSSILRTGAGGVPGGGIGASPVVPSSIRTSISPAGMVIPNNFQLSAAAIAAAANKFMPNSMGMKPSIKPAQQPSISITPLPRQSSNATNMAVSGALSKLQAAGTSAIKPGQSPAGGKTAFVVCEICDGYIKDLDQLRNHMQWIHKVKIHPKMIYNRPPLNCQKCQYRFFTDQGLERHLLGSHGLVTSSMQEAANKGKDAGRCPVCGRVYQWKLLNHVSRDHNMTLKPAHLSYKCTVCTATFGMYKQFESHVYSAHSTVAKKALDNKNKPPQQSAGGSSSGSGGLGGSLGASMRNSLGGGDSLLKPLKINDEITIIPQPTSNSKGAPKTIEIESHVID